MKLKLNYLTTVPTLILVCLAYLVFVFFNPVNVLQAQSERALVERAAKLAKVELSTFQSMAELGKTEGFKDIEALKKLSAFNEQVYKDAKKGDRAIAFANKMVVYRGGKLIYDGDSPAQLQLKDQQAKVKTIDTKLKSDGTITTSEAPQVALVADLEQLKGNAFYEKATVGDYVMVYANASIAVLVDSETQNVLNSTRLNAQTQSSSSSKR